MPSTRQHGPKELFRYARLKQPRIIDLQMRAQTVPALKEELARKTDRAAWARKFLESDQAIENVSDLRYDYFIHLKIKTLPADHLPSRDAIADPEAFQSINVRDQRDYRADCENCLLSLFAYKVLKREGKAAEAAKILNFLEIFPVLHTVAEKITYAPAVLHKTVFKKPAIDAKPPADGPSPEEKQKLRELRGLSSQLLILWEARNGLVQAKKEAFAAELHKLASPATNGFPTSQPAGPARRTRSAKAGAASALHHRTANLLSLKTDFQRSKANSKLNDILETGAKDLSSHVGGRSEREVAEIQKNVKDLLGKYGIDGGKFCQAYQAAVSLADTLETPALDEKAAECFREYPSLAFQDNIKIVGTADLVRVDETLIGYVDGEISYIENVLAGEIRKRQVKDTKYFEELTETTTEETLETSGETSTTAKQELSSQIDTELNTSLNADVNSSVNGSGSGTIGVVDFEGGATAGANLGVGVDTSLSTKNSSNLSHEIVSKAVEKLKKTSVAKRLTRSYALYETLNSYEIDNSQGSAAATRSGIYCFLDKRVCISETTYGKRMFLLANVCLPGRNLLCGTEARIRLATSEYGEKPTFKHSPTDITPANYRELVAQYKASGVQTPPSPILTLGKTYKTDNTNANVEQEEFKPGKIAEMLTPLFEKYKRFLVTDTLKLPDGYELCETMVTVNHGENGVSMPAHLPLKLAGAAAGTSLNLAAGAAAGFGVAILVPLAIWQFEYSASPLLHYNTDSSNVTICIGNESQDSSYYFFKPEVLMRELSNFLDTFAGLGPEIIASIQAKVTKLFDDLKVKAEAVPVEFLNMVKKVLDELIKNVGDVFNSLKITGSVKNGLKLTFDTLSYRISDLDNLLRKSKETMVDVFEPLRDFINAVIALLNEGLHNALADFLAFLSSMSDSTDTLPFYGSAGMKGDVPVSLNVVAIHPGVTVNLVACLRRTDDALDRWRLDTFNALYQSYLRLLAEYESKALMAGDAKGQTRSGGTLRIEETASLKERILHLLNNYHKSRGNVYDLDRMNLFENGLDWKNMSYRLYNYGPNMMDIRREKDGVFAGADDRRKAFLTALWAQVLIPAHPHPHLEKQVTRYFQDGTVDLEGDLGDGELAVLYQNLILGRQLIAEKPETVPIRTDTIPTDLIRVREDLPSNPDTCCVDLD